MPHRRCRKASAMFLCGVITLFCWQSTIYPVRGQSGGDSGKESTAKVQRVQGIEDGSEQKQIIVQKGETLWSLAQKYHISLEQLAQLNYIVYPDHIRAGQKLWVIAPDLNNCKELVQKETQTLIQAQTEIQVLRQNPGQTTGQAQAKGQAQTTQVQVLGQVNTFEIIVDEDGGQDKENSDQSEGQQMIVLQPSVASPTQMAQKTAAPVNPAQKAEQKEIVIDMRSAAEIEAQEQRLVKSSHSILQGIPGEPASASRGPQIPEQTVKDQMSKADLDLLARVIYAEARGEDFKGQVAVGAVVLNRLKDKHFPKTIREVIYQPGAFTAVVDKQIHLIPDEEAYRAAEAALAGEDPTDGALYYFNPKTATDQWIKSRPVLKRIGNHTFSI